MASPAKPKHPGGALGYARELLNSPDRMDKMGCVWGAAAVGAVAVIAMLLWAVVFSGEDDVFGPSPTPPARTAEAPAQSAEAPSLPAVENPTAVGQAVDAIAQPALEEVYGEATLASAPPHEALIVSLSYEIPGSPTKGDGEKVRNAFIRHGATVDPANSEMDYHQGEGFVLLLDTGNPAFKTVRVNVIPDSKTINVNADKSE